MIKIIFQSCQRIHGGDVPDVEFKTNENSEATLAAREKKIYDAWHANCFAYLVRARAPKYKMYLNSGVDAVKIMKELTEIGNLRDKIH